MPEVASTPIFSALASSSGRTGTSGSTGGKDGLPGESAQGSFASILKQQFKQPQQTQAAQAAQTAQTARSKPADAADQTPDPATASIAALAGNFPPLQQAGAAQESGLPGVGDAAAGKLPSLAPDETTDDTAGQTRPDAAKSGEITDSMASTQIHGLPVTADDAPASPAPDAQAALASQGLPAAASAANDGSNPLPDAASEAAGSKLVASAGDGGNTAEQAARHAIPVLASAASGNPPASDGDHDSAAPTASRQTTAPLSLSQARQQGVLAGDQNKTAAAEFAGTSAAANDAAATRGAGATASQTNFDQLLASAHTQLGQLGQAHPLRDSRIHAEAPARMEAPLGSSAWNREIGDKLVWMVGRQEQRAELVLNPPQLGRVEISLSLRGEQTNATFMAANPAVREALENALPRLREMFAEAGLSLGQAQVGADSGSHATDQSFANRGNGDNSSRFSTAPDDAADGNMTRLIDDGSWLRQGRGMVDVFA
ncbi:putative Flagellar hook-length control protein [Sterolibacterium denitrificans]|uniref:Flagellar hook-length control protein n=2 Tax=Sterolibacterium denitrificans TaxID=157592 RepID=A0A7Z7HTM5_9PROT|nr:flagellar hook-length control protein FliK [Sterolibacterium denitrificans]KYC29305.1 hypothetical protein ACY05_01870 [Sterolibacterium denitrificans]SMB30621.1 putative Flagellar hook-length control protein [Sterolibacterium denitrificans]